MNKKVLYRKAYRLLENSTPLRFDCGLLCGSKCCTGDSEMGMYLFPGEEAMFEKRGGFLSIRKEKMLDTDVLFAVCSGTCDRKYRPLSCRIFPYVPYLGESGRLTIVPYLDEGGRLTMLEDPRARYICPLLMESFEFKVDRIFIRKLREVFHLLIQDEDIRNHMRLLSKVLDEYRGFLD